MLKLWNKKQVGGDVEETVAAQYNDEFVTITAAEIHQEFGKIGQQIVAEAKAILEQGRLKDADEIISIHELGFKNAKNVRDALEQKKKLESAKETVDLVEYYAEKYPGSSFLTYDKLVEICEKYGLVRGDADCFIGNIPAINRREILGFKLKPEDNKYYKRILISDGISERDRSWKTYDYEKITYNEYVENKDKKHGDSISYFKEKGEFQVIATQDQFDMKNKIIDSHYRIVTNDPIVLISCKGGYLVVTKWGDEAEYEI